MDLQSREQMIERYKYTFQYYLLSLENNKGEVSERERYMYLGRKEMMEVFFSKEEINSIENEMRVYGNDYLKSIFETVENWIDKLYRNCLIVEKILFTYDKRGIERVKNECDYILNDIEFMDGEYKGFANAIQLIEEYYKNRKEERTRSFSDEELPF